MRVIKAEELHRWFPGDPPVTALKTASLEVEAGEKVAIYGPSGAGKSTLLNLLGLLDAPSSGTYQLLGKNTEKMSEKQKDKLRAESIGFVFQNYQILGHRKTWENIDLKLAILQTPKNERSELITQALQAVGLTHRANSLARNLSGGEKQRLAIARAIVHKPQLLLADEPTGNLDRENSNKILNIFDDLTDSGIAVIAITHDEKTQAWAHRSLNINNGTLSENQK